METSNQPNSKFSKMVNLEVLVISSSRPKRAQKKLSRSSTIVTNTERRSRFSATSRKKIERSKVRNTPTFSSRTFLMTALMMNSKSSSLNMALSDQLPST